MHILLALLFSNPSLPPQSALQAYKHLEMLREWLVYVRVTVWSVFVPETTERISAGCIFKLWSFCCLFQRNGKPLGATSITICCYWSAVIEFMLNIAQNKLPPPALTLLTIATILIWTPTDGDITIKESDWETNSHCSLVLYNWTPCVRGVVCYSSGEHTV